MSSNIATIAVTLGLIVVIPLAIAAERSDFNTWQSRLALPDFKDSVSRHTPLHAIGTVLPPTITADLNLTAADNPIIVVRETHVPVGVTLTLNEGTNVFAHEFATLHVAGRLHIAGTPNQSIELTTNELHPDNKVWNGIVVSPNAVVTITHTTIRYAAPALTCLPGSGVTTDHLEIKNTNQDIFGC